MRRSTGFTLIELLICAMIVSILASIALPLSELTYKRKRERELKVALREIRAAIDAYKKAVDEGKIAKSADESGYPRDLSVLVKGVPNLRVSPGGKIYFLRRLPRDPMADDSVPAESTWGKRSYDSPPEQPRDGKDVFDVYSLSTRAGINGIPYQQW